MEENLVCPICGAPTRVYMGKARKDRLCGKHADLLKAGKIAQNADGTYSKCDKEEVAEQRKEEHETTNYKKRCIICNNEADEGFLFCKNCYFKYKNKVLLLRITNCKNIEVLDSSYEGSYTCADGHIVKSKSELAIDDYLFRNHIAHSYEQAFPIDSDPTHDLHPDFYLPEEDIYIEHWGYDETNKKYTETKNYKLPIYEKFGITLICTTENDMKDINATLSRKLKFYEKGKINQ